MAEPTPLEDIERGKVSRQCRYFKMKVLKDHRAANIDEVVAQELYQKSIVFSDKSTSYVNIQDHVEVHIQEWSDKQSTITTLKWVLIVISNAQRWLLGIHT